jgi:hypothetical protein
MPMNADRPMERAEAPCPVDRSKNRSWNRRCTPMNADRAAKQRRYRVRPEAGVLSALPFYASAFTLSRFPVFTGFIGVYRRASAVTWFRPYLTALLLAATISLPAAAAEDVWSASYDAATQTRYIPLELILGAEWDGQRKIAMPRGRFTEGVARDPSTWRGPAPWLHPDLAREITVYDRARRGVTQKFAVRADGTAIGRVADSRNDISSCDGEGKYPLGYWKQGETREFVYRCWRGSGERKRVTGMITTIVIEEIDFDYGGVPHSLQLRWILKHEGDPREIDNRVYVFSPGRGAVAVR